MFDVLNEAGEAQHPATLDYAEACRSCDALNAVEKARQAASVPLDSDGKPVGNPTYKAKKFFVEQRLIRYPAEYATAVAAK